jgi:inosine/xanthosine triphosphate pyrophosphatase family protein
MALKLEPGIRLVVATHNPGKARELAEILDNRFTCPSRTRPKPPSSATPC